MSDTNTNEIFPNLSALVTSKMLPYLALLRNADMDREELILNLEKAAITNTAFFLEIIKEFRDTQKIVREFKTVFDLSEKDYKDIILSLQKSDAAGIMYDVSLIRSNLEYKIEVSELKRQVATLQATVDALSAKLNQ